MAQLKIVVLAYHNVGVRCLKVLMDQSRELGYEIALVLTHKDNPQENIWFENVESVAREQGIRTLTPDDPNTPEVIAEIEKINPDFLFSFYYRHMLKLPFLKCARKGAFNMHGSLLPRYRGRVPINWAIIHGETECGATLHVMDERPDHGAIVDQERVPILENDTAHEVFHKVVVIAEVVLARSLKGIIDGTAQMRPMQVTPGNYFGGRKAEDGRIQWSNSISEIHNLVRAVAPPYPGAFCDLRGKRIILHSTRKVQRGLQGFSRPTLFIEGEQIFVEKMGEDTLWILAGEIDGKPLNTQSLKAALGPLPIELIN